MGQAKKINGYVKSENVIWLVGVALLIGFVGGVAFGVYKSGSIVDPHGAASPAPADETRQKAIDELSARVKQSPSDKQAWIQLGHQFFDANRFSDAIRAYEKALAIDPVNADVWTDLGVMYRRNGDPQKAVEAFDQATKIDASHEISRLNKGVVLLYDLKDEAGAIDAWESLLVINPDAKTPGGQRLQEMVDKIKTHRQESK
jgi:cytochrome c-type biogenesis protein CcmH/NrfG